MRIFILILFLSGCASQDPWTKSDTVLQGITFATMIADAHMTSKIQYHPNIWENGFIAQHALGRNPSTSDTWQYMGVVMLSHYLVARALPEGWRTFWQVGAMWRHGSSVNTGHQSGVYGEPCTRHQEKHPCP